MHVTNGRGSVHLRQRYNTSCIFGFEDDVVFAHNGPKAQAMQVVVHSGSPDGSMVLNLQRRHIVTVSSEGSNRRGRSLLSTTA